MVGIVALRRQFSELPGEVRNHFRKLQPLLDNSDLDIALAYVFMLIEQGRYRAIKCVLVRKLRCSGTLVDNMFRDYQFQRKTFRTAFVQLVGIDIGRDPYNVLKQAESVRDKVFHGRMPQDADLRQALASALTFVGLFGERIRDETGKNPFGDLRGLSSRMKMLPNNQARWIIDGVKLKAEQKTTNPADDQ